MPKVGAFVLETLTNGMYLNPLDTLREYSQNAFDAIREAESQEVIREGEGRVEVILDPSAATVAVRDNGTGIPQEGVEDALLNVGMSRKRIQTHAGFRGIGRLAGIAYCDALAFHTSALGEARCTTVTIDCGGVGRAIAPSDNDPEELADVIASNTSVTRESCGKADHYFEVVMQGVSAHEFLDWKRLESYLGQVAPVDFDAHRFLFATKIKEYARELGLPIPTVTLVIRAPALERQVFKPYGGHYKTRRENYQIEVKDVGFYPEEPAENPRFWVWYGTGDLLGMIDDERCAGLRFRQNNIGLGGPERVGELFPGQEGRLNSWAIGEIYVCSPSLIPNARRDGFEEGAHWQGLKKHLQPLIDEHCRACHAASSSGDRAVIRAVASAKTVIAETEDAISSGVTSPHERDALLRRIAKQEEKVADILRSNPLPDGDGGPLPAVAGELGKLRLQIEGVDKFAVAKLNPTLDRKQRKMLTDILGVVNSALSSAACGKSEECYRMLRKAVLNAFQVREGEKKH